MKLHVTEMVVKEVTPEEFIQTVCPNIKPPKFAMASVALRKPKETGLEPTPVVIEGGSWIGSSWQYYVRFPVGNANIGETLNEDQLKPFP
jgi:hypothetical protein